ncbi:GFA family protein [Roseovarius sp. PS-C2]|uniref:GFA family protein n=1 Tax=Roseovarius sp. PS-C2 TaxID=2820814 RepID=UPI001C0E8E3A|nr:GFA family protein [Roseovarius sp. PS-C2]MBU3261111.1 GFA family protein [Roseovarius sp. PS-C2]
MIRKGHCLCGAVTFELDGGHNWIGHCHCDSCRRATGAPLVTFVGHPDGNWQWTEAEPKHYESSPGNHRYFCATCGSSVAYRSDREPDEMHFHAVLLDDPDTLSPDEVFHADERLSWVPEALPGCPQG